MLDPIPILCLLLLLWLVARDLSNKRSRSESPLLPQHRDDVRYTVSLHDSEQQSVSEHQRRSAPNPKAPYVHLEHEHASSQTVQLSSPAVSQGQNQTSMRTSLRQVEPAQSPVLVPQVPVSPTEPPQEIVQISRATNTVLISNVGGEVSQLPPSQDDAHEGSGDYVRLRERAKQERETIQKYRKEKRQAKASGQLRVLAELAEEIKKHRQRRQLFDEQASHLIFAKNNKNHSSDLVDFHGLTAEEAVTHAKRAINEARERGVIQMRLIVGKSLHSSGPPVLKPCMLKLMQKFKLPVEVDPTNEGVLVVQLVPPSTASPPTVWDQSLSQPSLLNTSQPATSPILVPHIDASPTEPDRLTDDSARDPVQNRQVTSTPLVPVWGEDLTELPQNAAHHDAEDGNVDFMMLREYAKQEKRMQLNCRKEKKLAKAGGQMALARELAKQENEHQIRRDLYDATAGELIFSKNNENGSLDKVILLNLKEKEATTHVKRVIQEAREKGNTEIRLVVGEQGSSGALKPAMLKFLRKKCGLSVEVDTKDTGVLVVKLKPQSAT